MRHTAWRPRRQRARRLEDGAGVLEHVLDRGADRIGVHQHDFVDQLCGTAGKSQCPTCLTATPSANRPTCSSVTRRLVLRDDHRVRIHRLHADDPDLRPQQLDVSRHAGDQPAAADRDEDRVDGPGYAGAGSPSRSCPARRSRPDRRRDGRKSACFASPAPARAGRRRSTSRRAAPPAPRALTASILICGVVVGITITALQPSFCAAAPRPAHGCRPRRRSRRVSAAPA